jgi:hypothetical protein
MKANWGTLYRLLMAGGKYSEKHVEKVKSQFQAADADGKEAILKKYQGSAKKAGQNKSLQGDGDTKADEPKRAREDDGTYKGDDPSTPDKNEAFDPPKKRSTGSTVKVNKSGKKG